jgi:hypothetical protein
MTCRQLENKSLADYVKRFKRNQDSLAQNMGKDFLMDFMKKTKQYTDKTNVDKLNKMQKGSYVQWAVYMLMKNNDQGKYSSLMPSLTTQFSMGTIASTQKTTWQPLTYLRVINSTREN